MILENFVRTDRQTDNKQTENSKPEATLIPMDSRGERANNKNNIVSFQSFHRSL